MDGSVQALVATAERLANVRYVKVATAMLLSVEGMETLPTEIKYIWKSKWSWPKVLYILARYTVWLDIALSLIHWFAPNIGLDACKQVYTAKAAFTFTGIAISELVLILRTYAIFMRSKKVLYSLGGIWTLAAIGNAIVVRYFLESVVFSPPPIPAIPGCNVNKQSHILFICFASFLLFEILIVVMTMKKAIEFVRSASGSQSRLMTVLYRDGVVYFLILMLSSLANCILLTTAPKEYGDLLTTVTRVLHAILCCRILINLREARDIGDRRDISIHIVANSTRQLQYAKGVDSSWNTVGEMIDLEYSIHSATDVKWVRAQAPEMI